MAAMVELVEVTVELLLLVLLLVFAVVVPRLQEGVSETAAVVDFLPRPLLPLPRPCPTP